MNLPTKPNGLQTFQIFLYRKALHPELFPLKGRRSLVHGAYEIEAWIMPGAHLMRFQHGKLCACELLTDQEGSLPMEGAVTGFQCAGEHEFEHVFESERVKYITSVQTEQLSENLYQATYDEMVQFAQETGALVHQWSESAVGSTNGRGNGHALALHNGFHTNGHAGAASGRNLSLLDVQRLTKEVHAQSYHLIARGGLVIRTQTIFEHA
ncbi:MAG: hypothetical protein KF869_04770 [Phycisphaeraceae bacterium]|nr:hypothetical protein [Phycisphaeraceae bacterium]